MIISINFFHHFFLHTPFSFPTFFLSNTAIVVAPIPSGDPCLPSPCGANSQCHAIGQTPACSCLPNYIGRPPNCRPECTSNSECPPTRACINEKCRDPCPGSCGPFATCNVVKHQPICRCQDQYTGDPFSGCYPTPVAPIADEVRQPCNPSPCGINAECRERDGAGSCSCIPEYFGDPYVECRPECILNTDCPRTKACVNQKCRDPCPGACGINAECHVVNHSPTCSCIPGYIGNPSVACHEPPKRMKTSSVNFQDQNLTEIFSSLELDPPQNPCQPSPCGPYSICREINGHGVCSCQPNYIGSPPGCRPECIVSSECSQDKACINQKCVDPCPGTCGDNARCQVINHNPICSCPNGYVGDPFIRCVVEKSMIRFSTCHTSLSIAKF